METRQVQLSEYIRRMAYLHENDHSTFVAVLDSIIRVMMIYEIDRPQIKEILENSLGGDDHGNDLTIKQRILEYEFR